MDFNVAGIQIKSFPNDYKQNIEKICHWYKKAVNEYESNLLVFPETVTTGFTPNMEKEEFYSMLPVSTESSLKPVMNIAKETNTYCIIPTYERSNKKNEIFNSAFLINNIGEIEGVYRKTHLFPTERIINGGWTTSGNEIPVFNTKYGKIGIMICYDGDFPELARILALKGAGLIAHPSAFLRGFEIWDMTNKARAYDNQVYVIGVNAIGQDAGGNYFFGHSLIINPEAVKISQAKAKEEIIHAKIKDLKTHTLSLGAKNRGGVNHLEHRNIPCYKNNLITGQ